jgi:hypothetical protein
MQAGSQRCGVPEPVGSGRTPNASPWLVLALAALVGGAMGFVRNDGVGAEAPGVVVLLDIQVRSGRRPAITSIAVCRRRKSAGPFSSFCAWTCRAA